jgi:hypothetical protein
MQTRNIRLRIARLEQTAKVHAKYEPACICFPNTEPPFFCSPWEEEIAARVKCPLHGNRFRQTTFHIYVAKWRRESEPIRRQRLSWQYQKAWSASAAITDSLARGIVRQGAGNSDGRTTGGLNPRPETSLEEEFLC